MTIHPEFNFTPLDPEEQALQDRWAKQAREESVWWSEENLCIAWVTQSDGRHWQEWWQSLPSYEREHWLGCYRFERQHADATSSPMRPASSYIVSQEEIAQDRAIVDTMVREIREAAINRRPMPRRESDEMDGPARVTFRSRLNRAFLQAGVVLISYSAA